jgi:anti-sigma factor (TIGR02949 family)
MSDCRHVQAVMEAFADGELTPVRVLDVEEHIEHCAYCAERLRFDHAVRVSTQRVVLANAAPTALRSRIRDALAAERQRERERSARRKPRVPASAHWLPWRVITPLAAAAAVTLVWGAQRPPVDTPSTDQVSTNSVASVGNPTSRLEQMLEEFVDYHSRAPVPEFTEPALMAQLEPEVGLPLRVPVLSQYGAAWEGGGLLSPTRGPRTASLRYRLGRHRITVYVYNSTQFPLRATLEPRVVGDLPVYVGERHGYSIAAAERQGIGYALATDLGDDKSAELAAALAQNNEEAKNEDVGLELGFETERF